MSPQQRTQIGTLQVRGVNNDTPAFRLALSNLLNSADLRPIGVSPSSVLIVRRMQDALPGRLMPGRGVIRVDTNWERAVQNALGQLHRQASRPARGYIPPDADAVCFADESEMLACLTLDMSRGQAQNRWWWQTILQTIPSPSSNGMKTLLCSKARYLPAILHHLVEWGQVITVANAISPEDTMIVLSAMSQTYGVADFRTDLVHPTRPRGERRAVENRQSERHKPEDEVFSSEADNDGNFQSKSDSPIRQRLDDQPVPTVKAPWARWLSPTHSLRRLGKERTCLLGIGLTLYHSPTLAQTRTFRQAARAWWANPDAPAGDTADYHGEPMLRNDRQSVDTTRKVAQNSPISESAPVSALRKQGSSVKTQHAVPTQQQDEAALPEPIASVEPDIPTQESKVAGDEAHPAETNEESTLDLGEGVDTQLAGVLYLINLMRHLNLPACFEDDWGLASQVGTWGTLEVLGRGLLGQRDGDVLEDPLWSALAELDGRELGELPGKGFPGCESYRLPKNWFDPVNGGEGDTYCWAADGRRMRLWSEKGYLLVECPSNPSTPATQAVAELQAYMSHADAGSLIQSTFNRAPLADVTGSLVSRLNANLSRWLATVLPYLRFRLRRALSSAADEALELEKTLLYQGRLYVTSSHVDLVMNIDDISLPVRLAGLDTNPGWSPDFGRVVMFHFE